MKDYLHICPKCKSADIKLHSKIDEHLVAFGAMPVFECNKCGFSGTIFPEIDVNEYKKLKKIKRTTNE